MIVAGFPGNASGGGGGGGLILSGSPATLSKFGTSSSLTTGNLTLTASGGTPPYTYLTTVPGGLGITVNSPTSSVTSFTASGLTAGNVVSATATSTVTDSLGATAQDTTNLNFERTGA